MKFVRNLILVVCMVVQTILQAQRTILDLKQTENVLQIQLLVKYT